MRIKIASFFKRETATRGVNKNAPPVLSVIGLLTALTLRHPGGTVFVRRMR